MSTDVIGLAIVICLNLLGLGVIYGTLKSDQKNLKEETERLRIELDRDFSQLRDEFNSRLNEIREELRIGRTRMHDLANMLMKLGGGKL